MTSCASPSSRVRTILHREFAARMLTLVLATTGLPLRSSTMRETRSPPGMLARARRVGRQDALPSRRRQLPGSGCDATGNEGVAVDHACCTGVALMSSRCLGSMFSARVTMRSSSVVMRGSRLVRLPMSPVANQPSARTPSSVSSGFLKCPWRIPPVPDSPSGAMLISTPARQPTEPLNLSSCCWWDGAVLVIRRPSR